jgi:hypothetical protein
MQGSPLRWEALNAVLGAVSLLVWLFLVTSDSPVLIVDARGVRIPLWRQHEVLG